MRTHFVLIAAVVLLFAACTPPVPRLNPDRISVIRSYTCDTDVAEPLPAWNPATYQIVMRSSNGFILHQEGNQRREIFKSENRVETGFPAWTSPSQFVFGPLTNLRRAPDGKDILSTQGLSLVDVIDGATKAAVSSRIFSIQGCRPRPDQLIVWAQSGRRMISVDRFGEITDTGEGFWPEPQVGKLGMAWQDTPVTEPDIWTGRPARGSLNVRWSKGEVDRVPGATQVRWMADGRVVATVMRGEPVAGKPWWTEGTDVVVIAPGGQVRVIAADARDPSPHPSEPLVAVTSSKGGVQIVGVDGGEPMQLNFTGNRPQWSHDGLRILTEETANVGTTVRVHVLRIDPPRP